MKKLFRFLTAAIFLVSGNLYSQNVYTAAEAFSVNSGLIAKALNNKQFSWTHYNSKFFTFHYLPDKWPKARLDSVSISMDKAYQNLCDFFRNADVKKPIDVFLAGDKEDVRIICGGAYSAAALLPERGIVFSNHPATTDPANLPHEIMHVCSMDKWGLPYDFLLSEGLASYACGKAAFNYEFHSIIKYLKTKKKLPELTDLIKYFYRYNEITGYYSGASFVKFILDKHGLNWLKTLWTYGVEAGSGKLGTSVKKLEKEWHSTIMNSKSIAGGDWERLSNM